MKKDGKYRFSLQFSADSEERIRAGELLEKLGNGKSTVVVCALNEYINSHPELLGENCKIEVKLTHSYNRDRIEELIRTIVDEKLGSFQPTETDRKLWGKKRHRYLKKTSPRCWIILTCSHS